MADNGDRMFCHACGGVWLRDESGLTCPHCESDFTEIVRAVAAYFVPLSPTANHVYALQIEIPPDPDTPPPLDPLDPDTEPHSPPINPWVDHNPWAQADTSGPRAFDLMDSGSPRYTHRTYRSPDGRFSFSSTTVGNGYSPRQTAAHPNPMVPMMLQSLDTMFQELSNMHDLHGQRSPDLDDPFAPHSPGFHEHEFPGGNRRAGHEGLFPRDTDRPQPITPPVGSLAEYVRSIMNTNPRADAPRSLLEAFRTDSGPRRGAGRHGAHGVHVHGAHGAAGPNPLAMLSALLNMNRNGDAVYSQEELDHVIAQLIDQNAPGSAPPPASETAIRSLPKKKVDEQMLGPDRRLECSICMDAVELGTEVTVLPCTHWFHFNCIEAWLTQHNTCPHCRRSIDSVGA